MEGLPNEGNSAFLNVLEWIIYVARGSTWAMDRVRRVATQGAINSVGLVGGKLALSPEKSREAGQCGVSNLVIFPEWRIFISGLMLQLPWRLVRIFFLVWSC